MTRDAPPERAHVLGGVDHERAQQQLHRPRGRSHDPELRDDLIALGLDPTTLEQDGNLNALGFDLQHSTADNLLNARRGYQIAFHAEQAGRLVPGDLQLLRARRLDGRHYLPFGERVVVRQPAADGQHPAGRPGSDERAVLEEVLPRRRDEHPRLGPLRGQPAQRPACRSAATACSRSAGSCARCCAASSAACCFSTPATSGPTRWAFDLNDLRYAVGPGLRYQTPVGPIRFDVGYQLNPIPGLLVNGAEQKRPLRFHFSIGQAF